ncbi:MAG: aryl-sulfate sulfotransferase [Rhodospirillales bacterium]|nr:aryl-sulfate sulfotransferase [Rhodospirillales bacterium]
MRYHKTGLLHHDPAKVFAGYTLVTPIRHSSVFLVDINGEVAHEWELPGALGSKAYLLPGGNLLFSTVTDDGVPIHEAKGGHIHEVDWDGNLVWQHVDHNQHHDIRRLESGNTIFIAWEELTGLEQARVQGGIPGTERDGKTYADIFREVDPSGKIVWEWHLKDQVIEDFPIAMDCERFEFAHSNSCAPAPDGNILVNFRSLDTMGVIDRATKEFIWKRRDAHWGHPHNPEYLPNGNITFFANGMYNPAQPLHSRAIEMNPVTGEIVWQYIDPQPWTFFSPIMGCVQRLANGNTLTIEAINGRIIEVTQGGELVWEYINPVFHDIPMFGGPANPLFRAYRYAADGPEIEGRI